MKDGVWFEPVRAFHGRKSIGQWTPIHDIFARSWVINGAVTQERFHKFRWVQKRISAKSVADVELKSIVCTCAKDGTASGVACGWAVVQVNLDGGEEPRCGVGGIMPFELETQRTIKKGEIRALYMALC